MDPRLKRLEEIVLERSFQYRPDSLFKLASGAKSPYYFDCKKTTLNPEGSGLIGEILLDKVRNWPIAGVGGLTLGADPIAAALMHAAWYREKRSIPQFVVRKKLKDHGAVKWVEGNLTKNEQVLIVDDVVTTGASVIEAIKKAREDGLKVFGVIVLVDREEFEGMEKIRKAVRGHVEALITRSRIFSLYNTKEKPTIRSAKSLRSDNEWSAPLQATA